MSIDLSTWNKDEPTCPYCEHKLEDWWEHEGFHRGDSETLECSDCENEYECEVRITYLFDTEKGRTKEEIAKEKIQQRQNRPDWKQEREEQNKKWRLQQEEREKRKYYGTGS